MAANTHTTQATFNQPPNIPANKPEIPFIRRQAPKCIEDAPKGVGLADKIPKLTNEKNKGNRCVTLTQLNGEPRVDSRTLSKQLSTQHKSIIDLIDKHADNLQMFGHLLFQTAVGKGLQNNGKDERVALLNDDQAFLLLALRRNTDRAIEVKSDLIIAFRTARYAHAGQTLEDLKMEASRNGRRLARWRHDKQGIYEHVAHLKEQLTLPLDL